MVCGRGWAGRRPAPERAGSGEDVGVGQRALDEPDGINGGERHGPESDRGNAHQAHSQSPDRRKAKGGNDEHGLARDLGKKARGLPPQRQIDAGQRGMSVGRRGEGNQRAGVKEVQRRGDVVAGLVPVVWQGEQGEVAQVERREDDREDHPGRKWRVGPRLDEAYPAQGFVLYLIDRSLREVVAVRLQVKCAEGLLVLGQVLSQHVPQSLGLLRAEENRIVVADGDLVGSVARSQAEDQLEVPDADADLDAVGVGLA